MSTRTLKKGEVVIPSGGQYNASIFANIITVLVSASIVGLVGLFLYGLLNLYAGYRYFNLALDAGILEFADGKRVIQELTQQHIAYLGYSKFVRAGFAYTGLAIAGYYPVKWLAQNYGRQSVKIDEEGVRVKKWPRFNEFTTWDGVLDITVKPSESVFSTVVPNQNKIVIYTMDKSMGIEGMTLSKNKEISEKLKLFGDSLEERVIDFGYGAQLAIVWRRMKRNKIGVLGAVLVVGFIVFALVGALLGVVFPINTIQSITVKKVGFVWNPNFTDWTNRNSPPSLENIFGTDQNGRDIFSRLLFGAFYSILIGVIATTISIVIGGIVGATAGYIGGTFDQLIQRLTEILNSLPGLPILLLISASVSVILDAIQIEGAYYLAVYSIFALIGWGGVARVLRAEVLGLKYSEFIQAQIVLGSTHWRIIRKHIIPNVLSTLIIYFTLGVAGNIIGVASLSFLGFGSNSTLVWGKDLSDAIFNQPLTHWWGVTFISLFLFLLVLGFNLVGDTLRDALDPTLKS